MAAQHPILFLISKARRALINRWRWSRVRQAHDGGLSSRADGGLALYYLGVTHYSYGEGPLPFGRACLRILSMAALSLSVEYLKVLMVEYLKVLWSSLLTHPLDGGPISRVPKGDGGLNSRACLRILGVEYLSSPLGSST